MRADCTSYDSSVNRIGKRIHYGSGGEKSLKKRHYWGSRVREIRLNCPLSCLAAV